MKSQEQLQRQLHSLTGLRDVVKTMKALSAASIRQYEQAAGALAHYHRTVERGLYVVLKDLQPAHATRRVKRGQHRLAAVVFGSDHGLCGRFNQEIVRHALGRMDAAAADPDSRLLLAVGARVAAALESEGQVPAAALSLPGLAAQITDTVTRILLQVDEWRESDAMHYLYVFYNRPAGSRHWRPTGLELLPLNLGRFHRLLAERWPSRSLPTYTMQQERLLARLLRQYLFVTIFRACAESQASEHASRLAAMHAAQRNLDERLDEVTAEFRRARQTAITAELMDVVAGFEASSSGSAPFHG